VNGCCLAGAACELERAAASVDRQAGGAYLLPVGCLDSAGQTFLVSAPVVDLVAPLAAGRTRPSPRPRLTEDGRERAAAKLVEMGFGR
jgi:hypothetical protein